MKTCSVIVLLLCLALPLQAAQVTKTPGAQVLGTHSNSFQDRAVPPGNVAVVCFYEGTFTDLGGEYTAALAAQGLSPDLYQDPTWDCYSGYPLVVVSMSDNWWTPAALGDAFPLMASYMDGGGRMILVGQDFLYGAGPDGYMFASMYLGMADAIEEMATGDFPLTWYGSTGGPLEGLGQTMAPCFNANDWYVDEIIPIAYGAVHWTNVPVVADVSFYEGGSASPVGIFSTVEFGCGTQLDDVMAGCLDWLEPGFDTITVYPDGSGYFPTIQDAMDAISEGGTIYLADGIFSGPGNYALFTGGKNFTLKSLSGNRDACILDPGIPPRVSGPGGRPDPNQSVDRGSAEARHIIFYQGETPNFRVEDITFQHGWCSVNGGASIWVESASPTFSNCAFYQNLSTGGGAVLLENSSSTFENCVFEDNLAMGLGICAGLAVHEFSAPLISDCIFMRNAAAYGSAVDIFSESEGRPGALFTDCVFWENEAEVSGTVLVENTEPVFEHCTFDGNMAAAGSAFWAFNNFTVDACIIFGGNSRPFWCDGPRGCPTSVTCTNIYGNSEGNWLEDMAALEGVNGNHALHPQFCNMIYPELEDWTIQDDSSCAPGSEYCYGIRIGARDVDCGNQATRELNWSEVKTLY